MRPGIVALVGAVAAVAATAGCGSDGRPSDAEWAVEWQRERELAPTPDDLAAGGQAHCDDLVGEFREVLPRLTPTPTEALDDAVRAWVAHAENIVFECPHDPDEIERRLDELAVLAAEIDAGLSADTD